MSKWRPYLHRILERVLAAVLGLAVIMKARELHYPISIAGFGQFKFTLLRAGQLLLESGLALWLFRGRLDRRRFLAGVSIFSFFSVVAFFEAVLGEPSCGCFGNAPLPPAFIGIFDLSAVIALWATRTKQSSPRFSIKPNVAFAILTIAISIGTAGFSFAHASGVAKSNVSKNSRVADPLSWINHPFPLFDSIKGSAQLKSGNWVVVMYHFDCDECRRALRDYRKAAELTREGNTFPKIAFIAIPPLASPSEIDPGYPTQTIHHFALDADKALDGVTPIVFSLRNGKVRTAAVGAQSSAADTDGP